jgi:shikimate dehydrogenase
MSAIKLGLIGHPLGHSMSPYIHERIMEASGISGRYELYDIDPKEMDRYVPFLLRELHGFNCTIPHKERIIGYLDGLDSLAGRLGAINTVFERRGYNTDRDGFTACSVDLKDKNVLILGAGGVARMLAFEAADAGAAVNILAIYKDQAEALIRDVSPYARMVRIVESEAEAVTLKPDVVMNATPLGMWPQYGALPEFSRFIGEGMRVFDTVYNPPATRFILRARKNGAQASGGLPMLFYQALAAQRIWNPDADFNERRLLPILKDLPREMLKKSPVKIILTGFMGSGKTTIGRLLAEHLGVSFVDLDDEIQRICGCAISEIFARDGEDAFRKIETDVYREYLKRPGSLIIATGGGLIVREENRRLTEEFSALNVFLDAPIELLWERIKTDRSRPLAGTEDEPEDERFMKVARLFEARLPEYQEHGDVIITADREPEQIARDVAAAIGYGGLKI